MQGLDVPFDGKVGCPGAVDGAAIMLWKTAANSALAATYLARTDARTLLMVGAGALAPYLVRAHYTMHPIVRIMIWYRSRKNNAWPPP
jgi:alanine dehydrogenase